MIEVLTSYARFIIKNMWFQIYTYHTLVELNLYKRIKKKKEKIL